MMTAAFVISLLMNQAHADRLISCEHNLAWLPRPNTSEWILTDQLPTDAPITGAYALVRRVDAMLIARHRERGWEIPGGHVDAGETPEVAAARETTEETGAVIKNLRLVAVQRLRIKGRKPEGYKYPFPVSYQALYVADLDQLDPFVEEEDMVERALHPFAEALDRVGWIGDNAKLRAAFLNMLERSEP